jgi:hypothetical protein
MLLALTQHVLVQLAYRLAYPLKDDFFRHYAVVGDDIVLKDDKTALHYKKLLCDLDIPINESKSLTSQSTFEFCKKTIKDGVSLGSISLKGIAAAGFLNEPGLFYQLYVDRKFPFCYSEMCRLFSKKSVWLWLKLSPSIKLEGQPTSLSQIPSEVTNHAVRTVEINRALRKKGLDLSLTVDNARPEDIYHDIQGNVLLSPWVNRINYSAVIAEVFWSYRNLSYDIDLGEPFGKVWSKTKKKALDLAPNSYDRPCPWAVALACKANSFYLSYLVTYSSNRERSPFRMAKAIGRRRSEIYRLCYSHHQFWNTSDKLGAYSIDPENLRSLKIAS